MDKEEFLKTLMAILDDIDMDDESMLWNLECAIRSENLIRSSKPKKYKQED